MFTDSDLARLFEKRDEAALDRPMCTVMVAQPTTVPSGTRLGDAVALLEQMNIAMFGLRQALLAGDEPAYQAARAALKRLSGAWLYHAPLHKVADLLPAEGEA